MDTLSIDKGMLFINKNCEYSRQHSKTSQKYIRIFDKRKTIFLWKFVRKKFNF